MAEDQFQSGFCKRTTNHEPRTTFICLKANIHTGSVGIFFSYGRYWRESPQGLLENLVPFRLACLEALLRVADWRAERIEAEWPKADNGTHELDRSHTPLAEAPGGRTTSSPAVAPTAQGGAQHGVRGRGGGPADAGAATRPPHVATRYLNTTLGVLSYAELAHHLATCVANLQRTIAEGEFDNRLLDIWRERFEQGWA